MDLWIVEGAVDRNVIAHDVGQSASGALARADRRMAR